MSATETALESAVESNRQARRTLLNASADAQRSISELQNEAGRLREHNTRLQAEIVRREHEIEELESAMKHLRACGLA